MKNILVFLLFFVTVMLLSNTVHPVQATFQSTPSLQVNWGVPVGQPVFNFDDNKPCDNIVRQIKVKNISAVTKVVKMKFTQTGVTSPLASVLEVKIEKDGSLIFGGTPKKSLQDLFNTSGSGGLNLGNLASQQEITITITVFFPCSAGNEYQKKQTKFDIIFHSEDSGPTPTCTPRPTPRPTPPPFPTIPTCPTLSSVCAFLYNCRALPTCSSLFTLFCSQYGTIPQIQTCRK